jgi:cobalt/nickel transport system permease protein
VVVVGLVVAVALALFVSPFATSSPDGLEKVAAENGLDTDVEDHALADGPLAGYDVDDVGNDRVSAGLAGLVGVAVTFGVGVSVFALVKAIRHDAEPRTDAARGSSDSEQPARSVSTGT